MNDEEWREVAFSYDQIRDFVSILAMPQYEIKRTLPFGSEIQKCFCIGFYYFVNAIKEELNDQLAKDLLDLAVRTEQASKEDMAFDLWDQNADTANMIMERYFSNQT